MDDENLAMLRLSIISFSHSANNINNMVVVIEEIGTSQWIDLIHKFLEKFGWLADSFVVPRTYHVHMCDVIKKIFMASS